MSRELSDEQMERITGVSALRSYRVPMLGLREVWAEYMQSDDTAAFGEAMHALVLSGGEAVIRLAVPHQPQLDQDGYYDSSGEWWQDAHHYVPSDTDEVLKLIDETLS